MSEKLARKVGVAITKRFNIRVAGQLVGGLSPVVTVYDEADSSFSTPTVSEPITGVYEFSFTPDAAGTWTAKMAESTPSEDSWAWDVEASLNADVLATIDANLDAVLGALVLRTFTAAASSTASEVRTGSSTTIGNDYYKGAIVVVHDVSEGEAQARVCGQYFQTSDRFLFTEDLGFTPEAGVDLVYVVSPLSFSRLLEVLDYAATANPPSGAWMDLQLNKDGGQTYDQGTDSQEALAEKQADIETDTQDIQGRIPAALVGGRIDSNVGAVSGDATAADNLEADYDGTGYNKSASEIATVATLTGHTPQTGDNFARLGAPAGASVSADIAAVKTDTGNLVTRITATLFSGITSLAEWLGLMAGKQAGDATARTELQATGAGSGTFDETTDSNEAIRDTEPLGTAMRGTDSALLESSAPTNFGDLAITSSTGLVSVGSIATDAVNAAALATDALTEIENAVWNALTSGHSGGGTFGQLVSAIYTDTNGLEKATLAATLAAAAGSSTTEVRSNATQADNFYDDAMIVVINAAGTAVRNVTSYAQTNGAFTVDALPFTPSASDPVYVIARSAASAGGGGLTAQEVRDAMKLAPTAGAPAAESVDEKLDNIETDTEAIQPTVATNLDAAVSSRSSHSAADVDTTLTASHGAGSWQTATGFAVAGDEMTLEDGAITAAKLAASAITASAIATDAITNAKIAAGAITSSEAPNLDAAVSSRSSHSPGDVDTTLTASHGAGAWTTATGFSTHSANDVRDAILADSTPFNGADVGTIATGVAALQTTIGAAGAGLTGVPWNAAWDAEVESEVNDALDTAIPELGVGIPSATPSLRTGLQLLYMALRNRLDVATSGTPDYLEIHNDAGTVIAKKQLSDDGSDYSEAKAESG